MVNQLTPYNCDFLSPPQIQTTASLVAEAFRDNAAYTLVFSRSPGKSGLDWLFERRLRIYSKRPFTLVAIQKENSRVVGTATLLPSHFRVTHLEMIRNGLLAMPYRFGFHSVKVMFALMDANQREVHAAMDGQPHSQLATVAVDSLFRRKGIGSALVKQLLDETRAPIHPIVLTTQTKSNVSFYERLGFRVKLARDICFLGKNYFNWTMTKS